MPFSFEIMKSMPPKAKLGISSWLLSWVWFISIYYYKLGDPDGMLLKLGIAIGLLAIFLVQAQNWARLISLLANAMGILLSVIFLYKGLISIENRSLVFIGALNFILFCGAMYFLMIPSTVAYFKSHSRKDDGKEKS